MKECFKNEKIMKLTFYFNSQCMQISREAWERQTTKQEDMKVGHKA